MPVSCSSNGCGDGHFSTQNFGRGKVELLSQVVLGFLFWTKTFEILFCCRRKRVVLHQLVERNCFLRSDRPFRTSAKSHFLSPSFQQCTISKSKINNPPFTGQTNNKHLPLLLSAPFPIKQSKQFSFIHNLMLINMWWWGYMFHPEPNKPNFQCQQPNKQNKFNISSRYALWMHVKHTWCDENHGHTTFTKYCVFLKSTTKSKTKSRHFECAILNFVLALAIETNLFCSLDSSDIIWNTKTDRWTTIFPLNLTPVCALNFPISMVFKMVITLYSSWPVH